MAGAAAAGVAAAESVDAAEDLSDFAHPATATPTIRSAAAVIPDAQYLAVVETAVLVMMHPGLLDICLSEIRVAREKAMHRPDRRAWLCHAKLTLGNLR